ncbi:MAG TPA: class I SAM-dependent methyltransferase [Gaiellaceae bacterium]
MTSYRDELDRALAFTGVDHELAARARADELVSVAERHLGDPAALDALDAGCGIGLTDRQLHGRFASLSGTDVSAVALETAARANPGVRYELAERGRLPFRDGRFDFVFASHVLQVVPVSERPRFVSELARVTRGGGLVAVVEHNPYNPGTWLVVRRFRSDEPIVMLPPGRTKRLLRENGLTPVDAAFFLLMPSRRSKVLRIERSLRRLPVAAQYYVAAWAA